MIKISEALEAIENSKGFITTIARRLGCNRSTVYRLRDRHESIRQAIEDEREKQKDYTEGKLFELIDDKNVPAVLFYLKTQAKDRGYIERQELEHTGKGGKPIEFTEVVVELPDESLDD